MKYLSLDIETTGVKVKHPGRIIQLSGVVEDCSNLLPLAELPHFTCFIDHEEIAGESYALWMNGWILKEIAESFKNKFRKPDEQYKTMYPVYFEGGWVEPFMQFLTNHFGPKERVTMAGKNAGVFDLQFLPKSVQGRFRSRILDPGSAYADFSKDSLPGLDQICAQLGIKEVTHDAKEDALLIVEVMRRHPRFPNFGA